MSSKLVAAEGLAAGFAAEVALGFAAGAEAACAFTLFGDATKPSAIANTGARNRVRNRNIENVLLRIFWSSTQYEPNESSASHAHCAASLHKFVASGVVTHSGHGVEGAPASDASGCRANGPTLPACTSISRLCVVFAASTRSAYGRSVTSTTPML